VERYCPKVSIRGKLTSKEHLKAWGNWKRTHPKCGLSQAAWPVLFRPFLDPPFIDMRALGVGEVSMDLERVAEPRPRRRLVCPPFDGFERMEAKNVYLISRAL